MNKNHNVQKSISLMLGKKTEELSKDIDKVQSYINGIQTRKKYILRDLGVFKKLKQKENVNKLEEEFEELKPSLKNISSYKKILKIYKSEHSKLKRKTTMLEKQNVNHWVIKNKNIVQKEFQDKIALLVKIYQDLLEAAFYLKQNYTKLLKKNSRYCDEIKETQNKNIKEIILNIDSYLKNIKNKIKQKGSDLQKLNKASLKDLKKIIAEYAEIDHENIYMEKVGLSRKLKSFENYLS